MNEKNLDGSLLSIKLYGDTIVNPSFLTVADFSLAGFPAGISITDTVFTSLDSVVLSIAFNDINDFDADSPERTCYDCRICSENKCIRSVDGLHYGFSFS